MFNPDYIKNEKASKKFVFVKKLLGAQLQKGGFFKTDLKILYRSYKNSAPEGRNSLSSSNANSPLFLIREDMEQTQRHLFAWLPLKAANEANHRKQLTQDRDRRREF